MFGSASYAVRRVVGDAMADCRSAFTQHISPAVFGCATLGLGIPITNKSVCRVGLLALLVVVSCACHAPTPPGHPLPNAPTPPPLPPFPPPPPPPPPGPFPGAGTYEFVSSLGGA